MLWQREGEQSLEKRAETGEPGMEATLEQSLESGAETEPDLPRRDSWWWP